jgi:hypothetical protein
MPCGSSIFLVSYMATMQVNVAYKTMVMSQLCDFSAIFILLLMTGACYLNSKNHDRMQHSKHAFINYQFPQYAIQSEE